MAVAGDKALPVSHLPQITVDLNTNMYKADVARNKTWQGDVEVAWAG